MNNEQNNNNLTNTNTGELNSLNLGNVNPNVVPVEPSVVPVVNENAYIASSAPTNNVVENVVNPTVLPINNQVDTNQMPQTLNSAVDQNFTQQMNTNPVVSNEVPLNNEAPLINQGNIGNLEPNFNQMPTNNLEPNFNQMPTNNLEPNFNQAPLTDTLVEPTPQIVVPENESVGAIPPNKKGNKKPMNKVLFIVLIVVLILGVAYGVYYFLSMNSNNSSVIIKELSYNIYDNIPSDINSYATFENIDSTTCSLNISNIDNTKAGVYAYSITCGEESYYANVTIIDNIDFLVETQDIIVYKDSVLVAEDFIVSSSKENVTYVLLNEDEITENLSVSGNYEASILATDESGYEQTLVVQYTVVRAIVTATSTEFNSENYDTTYTIMDLFYIDNDLYKMGDSYRYYTYIFDSSTYETLKSENLESSEFDGYAGTLTFDDDNYSITIEVLLTDAVLDIEYDGDFPEDYSSINTYYKDKGYSVIPKTSN